MTDVSHRPAGRSPLQLREKPCASPEIVLRRAHTADLDGLQDFIASFTHDGALLPRPRRNLSRHLRDFHVAAHAGRLVGCGALELVEDGLGEIRSIAVLPEWQGRGIGGRIVQALIGDSRRLGMSRLFCLTRRMNFFEGHGFVVVDRERYPQKVWRDCRSCARKDACDETAMERVGG